MTQFPAPALEGDGAPFWLALQAGRLDVQSCGACATLRHPPSPVCRTCGSRDVAWTTVSGRAEVWSHTTVHPPTLPAFSAETPYHAYVVRLVEGPFLVVRAAPGVQALLPVGTAVDVVPVPIDSEYGAATTDSDTEADAPVQSRRVVLPAIRPC